MDSMTGVINSSIDFTPVERFALEAINRTASTRNGRVRLSSS